MAELLLKVGDKPSGLWDDGDIISAVSRRRIKVIHAQHITHPTEFGFTGDGLRANGTLLEERRKLGCLYKFERISATEIRRTNLDTLGQETFGPPQIDVALYLERRLAHPRHMIFGSLGAEVWYGGNRAAEAQVDLLWVQIEARSLAELGELKLLANHTAAPWGRLDHRVHLPIRTEDLTDVQCRTMCERDVTVDGEGLETLVRQRTRRVGYRNFTSAQEQAQIADRRTHVDIRSRPQVSATVVERKA